MAEYSKPIPDPDPTNQVFFDGARDGKLMLPRCTTCNKVHFYPRIHLPLLPLQPDRVVRGVGHRLYPHLRRPAHRLRWLADETPYVTAYIDLTEGDRIFTALRGVDPEKPEEIEIGARVQVEFEQATEDIAIPFWRVV